MIVVKVGGSLFDLPDLADRLREYVARLPPPVVVVAGGGTVADAVRTLAATHGLSEAVAHWAALKAIAATAEVVRAWLPNVEVLDCEAFCRADGTLPETWAVTTDSIAARYAAANGAKLILLKSAAWLPGTSLEQAAEQGIVDAFFPTAAVGVTVEIVPFRGRD